MVGSIISTRRALKTVPHTIIHICPGITTELFHLKNMWYIMQNQIDAKEGFVKTQMCRFNTC